MQNELIKRVRLAVEAQVRTIREIAVSMERVRVVLYSIERALDDASSTQEHAEEIERRAEQS